MKHNVPRQQPRPDQPPQDRNRSEASEPYPPVAAEAEPSGPKPAASPVQPDLAAPEGLDLFQPQIPAASDLPEASPAPARPRGHAPAPTGHAAKRRQVPAAPGPRVRAGRHAFPGARAAAPVSAGKRLPAPKPTRLWTRILVGIGAVFLLLLLIAFGLWQYLLGDYRRNNQAQITLTNAQQEVVTPTPIPEQSAFAKGIQNILLIGSDTRNDGEHSLADVIMILTVNNNTNKLMLSSVQRDTLVYINGDTSRLAKVNSALQEGPDALMYTLNQNFSLDISSYVMIDMAGTEDIIDLVGGVDIDIPDSQDFIDALNEALYEQNVLAEGWYNYDAYTPDVEVAGLQHLNGRQALAYMRVRTVDSDYRRTERQREVLGLLLDKFKTLSAADMLNVVKTGLGYISSNMSEFDLLQLATTIVPKMGTMDQQQIPQTGNFWEDEAGDIVPGFSLVNTDLHQAIFGNLDNLKNVPEIANAPRLKTDYYVEPGTEYFIRAYSPTLGEAGAEQASAAELARQVAAGYSPLP
ncbi:MAG: LCP family protein [Oscillospiraceae bacterium]|nr:LCP family protein [Oscillospiraceae bacterium]MDD4367952.1 LCP family protein [Oscillospiraceae bacterium]